MGVLEADRSLNLRRSPNVTSQGKTLVETECAISDKAILMILDRVCVTPLRKTITYVRILKGTQTPAPPTYHFVLADCKTLVRAKSIRLRRVCEGLDCRLTIMKKLYQEAVDKIKK